VAVKTRHCGYFTVSDIVSVCVMVVLPETAVVVTVTFDVPVGVPGFPGVVVLPPPPPQPETARTTNPAISIEVFHIARFRGRTNSTRHANDNPPAPLQFIGP
jgi:hypothetical protein